MLSQSLSLLLAGLSLAGSAAAQSTPASNGPSPTVLQKCAASMNGLLPSPTPPDFKWNGEVRRYYVAAEEVEWNYAPTGWDNWLGIPLNLSPRAQNAGALQYGTTWLKALYRGYTDSSFSTKSEQPPWQGTQGPTIRSEVGDLIEIMFVNKLSKYYATMHSMGLEYSKYSEGADYPNNTMPGVNVVLPPADAVPPVDGGLAPGDCVVYKWMVNEASGPNFGEPAKVHSYHSYVDLYQDTNAGLIGPQIVYAAGQMNETMANYREIPLLYMIYNENESWLSGANAARLGGSSSGSSSAATTSSYPNAQSTGTQQGNGGQQTSTASQQGNGAQTTNSAQQGNNSQSQQGEAPTWWGPSGASGWQGSSGRQQPESHDSGINTVSLWPGNKTVWQPQVINLAGANQFSSAPSFFTMNGYIFANNPTFEMCLSDKVIWYVNAYGSASHVFHLHGNGVSYEGGAHPAVSINDGVGKTLYMNAVGQGKWQAICHVNNHHALGMVANYQVWPTAQCPLQPLGTSS